MKPPPAFFLLNFLLLAASADAANTTKPAISPTPSPTSSPVPPTTTPSSSSASPLDPNELQALRSLNIPTKKNPCIQPFPQNATVCDASTPFRHLISLRLFNCSSDLSLSSTALKSLSSLHALSFSNCHVSPIRFPSNLALSLTTFSCINSLRRLSGIWLARFVNLTDLTVSSTPISTSGLYVILGNMKKLKSLTISNANLTGSIPKYLQSNLSYIDLSKNQIKGTIPTTFI